MLTAEFLSELKLKTETRWATRPLDRTIYGFQFPPGTKWNPGLTEREISDYEDALRLHFPTDVHTLLRAMNGTNGDTINVYGFSGEPFRKSVGVYAYPQHLEVIKKRIEDVQSCRAEIMEELAEQGFRLSAEDGLLPIYGHRYVVCTRDAASSVVLSIFVPAKDPIVYANSLEEYLRKEFLD